MDPVLTDAPARIPFHGSPNPTLGVEVELQILDPQTCNLKQGSTQILDRVGEASVLPDFGSEIATPIVSPSTFQRAVA